MNRRKFLRMLGLSAMIPVATMLPKPKKRELWSDQYVPGRLRHHKIYRHPDGSTVVVSEFDARFPQPVRHAVGRIVDVNRP